MKILVKRHFNLTSQLMSDSMFHNNMQYNDVNGSGLSEERTLSSRFSVAQQAQISCYAVAIVRKRRKQTSQENRVVMPDLLEIA